MKNLTIRPTLFQGAVIAVLLGSLSSALAADMGAVQLELDHHRQQWQLLEPDEYVFRFERECFCLPEFVTPGMVHVAEGTIASVRHPVTDEALIS